MIVGWYLWLWRLWLYMVGSLYQSMVSKCRSAYSSPYLSIIYLSTHLSIPNLKLREDYIYRYLTLPCLALPIIWIKLQARSGQVRPPPPHVTDWNSRFISYILFFFFFFLSFSFFFFFFSFYFKNLFFCFFFLLFLRPFGCTASLIFKLPDTREGTRDWKVCRIVAVCIEGLGIRLVVSYHNQTWVLAYLHTAITSS